jgi:hypothetical protein
MRLEALLAKDAATAFRCSRLLESADMARNHARHITVRMV